MDRLECNLPKGTRNGMEIHNCKLSNVYSMYALTLLKERRLGHDESRQRGRKDATMVARAPET